MTTEVFQRELHAEIVRVCESLGPEKYYFCKPTRPFRQPKYFLSSGERIEVSRDHAVCGLLNKAFNTHRAILVLCNEGLADDAMALSRVLLENAISLAWMLQEDDWLERVDLYCMYRAAYGRRLGEVVEAHYDAGHEVVEKVREGVTEAVRAVAKEFFSDGWSAWARKEKSEGGHRSVSFEEMCKDLSDDGKRSFIYDFAYLDTSTYVHSSAPSLAGVVADLRDHYEVQHHPRREWTVHALVLANAGMLMALSAVDERMGLRITKKIEVLTERLKSQAVGETGAAEGKPAA